MLESSEPGCLCRAFGQDQEKRVRRQNLYTLDGYEAVSWFFFHASVTFAFLAVGASIQQRLLYASFRVVTFALTGLVYCAYCVIRAVYVYLWVGVWFGKQAIEDMKVRHDASQ